MTHGTVVGYNEDPGQQCGSVLGDPNAICVTVHALSIQLEVDRSVFFSDCCNRFHIWPFDLVQRMQIQLDLVAEFCFPWPAIGLSGEAFQNFA